MRFAIAFAIGAILVAGVAHAQEDPTDANAIARSEVMKAIGANVGVLGGMASGKEAYDAAKAEAAKAALLAAAQRIETAFAEPGAADPVSEAKPEIWTNWEDFLVKAGALEDAAAAIDVASVETIGAGMGPIGGTCRDCHTAYRVKK